MTRNLLKQYHNVIYRPLQLFSKETQKPISTVLSFERYAASNKWIPPRMLVERGLYTSATMRERRLWVMGESKVSPTKLRGNLYDDSVNIEENVGALEAASLRTDVSERELDTISEEMFQLYPDETTADTLFNGIKYVAY